MQRLCKLLGEQKETSAATQARFEAGAEDSWWSL